MGPHTCAGSLVSSHIMLQGEHLNRGFHGDVVTGRHPGGSVEQMWDLLGYGKHGGMHYNGERVAAKTILFSCRAPLIHPWLTATRMAGAASSVPLTSEKRVPAEPCAAALSR